MKPIRIDGRYGGPRLRDGLILCFFKQVPFGRWAEAVGKAFDAWLESIPSDSLTQAIVGSSSSKWVKVTPRVLSACRTQLDKKEAAKRKISGFVIGGPQETNPDYSFMTWGSLDAKPTKDFDRTCFVEMRFPTEMLDASGDAFAALATRLAELLEADSGYASLALHWSDDAELMATVRDQMSLGLRHPGLDLHHSSATRHVLGKRSRGARWWTYLGSDLVEELGGRKSLEKKLGKDVTVSAIGDGLALRAKGAPDAGDVNKGQVPAGEKAIAKAIESVTLFGDRELENHIFANDVEALDRWERRFLR